jgi:CheY-like chemotaxis protein
MARKVLLADDSTAVRKAVEAMLKPKGFQVLSAANGKEAMEQAKRARPDMILMDIDLPEGDGYEICRRIRKDPDLVGIPVLLLAVEGGPYEESRAREVGASGHLFKPFQGKELMTQVLSALDGGVDTRVQDTGDLEELDLGEELAALDEGLELEELDAEAEDVLELTEEMEPLDLEEELDLGEATGTEEEFTLGEEELDLEDFEELSESRAETRVEEDIEEFSFEEDLDLGDLELEGMEELSPLGDDLEMGEKPASSQALKKTEEMELGLDLDEELAFGVEEFSPEIDLPTQPEEEEAPTRRLEEDILEEAEEVVFPEEFQDTSIEFAGQDEVPLVDTTDGGPPVQEQLDTQEEAPFGDEAMALEETAVEWEGLEEVGSEQEEPFELDLGDIEVQEEGISAPEVGMGIAETFEEFPQASQEEGPEALEELELEEEISPAAGEDVSVPRGLDRMGLQEVPVESLPTLDAGLRLELTEEDFGLIDPFSEEGVRVELVRNLEDIVERILSDMAPSIVERVARDIALEQTERIVREEIERLKSQP